MMADTFKLWKNCDVYTPEHIGKNDILVAGERIIAIAPSLASLERFAVTEVTDLDGARVCPGLIDIHMHITGGGGEQGPASRVPEARLSEIVSAGVTSVVGLLGTDGISRSLENLLFKCRALNEEGITAFMLTGSYRYPSPTLTGSVMRDISLIDRVIGVKLAVSDHRSSGVTGDELIRLATEARVGGMISGKSGIVTLHMGASPARFAPIFYALEHSDVPAGNFLPTHCCRTPELVSEAVRFNKLGGTIDFTADTRDSESGVAAAVGAALREGADPARITVSSDSYGSQPKFNSAGECIGITYVTPDTLAAELRRLVEREWLPLETALRFFTANPARVMGLSRSKGVLAEGADADILALDADFRPVRLLARGRTALADGIPVLRGRFE